MNLPLYRPGEAILQQQLAGELGWHQSSFGRAENPTLVIQRFTDSSVASFSNK
jgi:hypothetical protein